MPRLWKSGKSNAFEKLFFENHQSLCRLVYRFVRDRDISSDIVQDVFVKYWKKTEENPLSTDSPAAYLRRACINEALNFLRETTRRSLRETMFAIETEKNSSTDEDLIAAETALNIQEAIERLPPACRQAFVLSRYEHMSYQEIASSLQISVNTVEKHVGKALAILRKKLQRD